MATAGDQRGVGPERAFHRGLALGTEVVLSPEESHHLCRVRRVAVDDPVVCFDGEGGSVLGTVVDADPRGARVRLQTPYPSREPAAEVTIAASVPEPARADAMVATLAELGVRRWIPLRCARTPARRMELVDRRRARWGRAAQEAAKVNGCARLMAIASPRAFAEVIASADYLLDPDPRAGTLAAALHGRPATRICLVVGPEGGFADEELRVASDAGLQAVTLGTCALRTGTAAVAAAAVCLAQALHEGS